MTLAIAHKEGEMDLLDAIRERRPPVSPEALVEEHASLIRSYRCSTVYGDKYAGEWHVSRTRGVLYEPADKSKSEI
jgi:hypothetical protein